MLDQIEKPTLGGIRKLQEYLNTTPFPMPVFRYDIYHTKKIDIFRDVPGEGIELNINELIKKRKPIEKICDCKIQSLNGKYQLMFTELEHLGRFTALSNQRKHIECMIEFSNTDERFGEFIISQGETLENLWTYGKEKVGDWDWLKLALGRYKIEFKEDNSDKKNRLIYCATPSRLSSKTTEIMDFVQKQGQAGLHPFNALPFNYFEGGFVSREKTMEYCLRLVDISDEFWMFGVSDGTLQEIVHSIRARKPTRFFLDFDSDWKKVYEEKGKKYGNPLDGILEKEFLN